MSARNSYFVPGYGISKAVIKNAERGFEEKTSGRADEVDIFVNRPIPVSRRTDDRIRTSRDSNQNEPPRAYEFNTAMDESVSVFQQLPSAQRFPPKSSILTVQEGDHLDVQNKDLLPYVLVKNLGHGASASVEMVRDTNTGSVYARKIFRNVYAPNMEEAKRSFHNELAIMLRLATHHHIIQIHATYIAQRELAFILRPVADGGDLAAFLQDYRDGHSSDTDARIPERNIKSRTLVKAFGCLASGLAFMHKQTVRHKDIKPQNILVHGDNVMYTDFGISLRLWPR
ncbi:kinase-like domain-containing protein [Massariosphaeria phaeospora]|uniref:mitogen-activated protein kinase kinase n=1 Tax=Massariosphaeria phaeospora TaxID=100035 RepID=A0A7C8I6S5_9PLEO|nr:kinase-like domain-containing protein [Massariosphaeria phaeospora]